MSPKFVQNFEMRIVVFLLLFASVCRAAIPGTTEIPNPLAPGATNSRFALIEGQYIKGSLVVADSLAQLQDLQYLPLERRRPGMFGSTTNKLLFRLDQDLTTWIPQSAAILSVGNTDSGRIENISTTVPTIAALLALNPATLASSYAAGGTNFQVTVFIQGYHTPGDGGEGPLLWEPSSTTATNRGICFMPTWNSWSGPGRWKRICEKPYKPEWFGAKGDNVTSDTLAIYDCWESSKPKPAILFGARRYYTPLVDLPAGAKALMYSRVAQSNINDRFNGASIAGLGHMTSSIRGKGDPADPTKAIIMLQGQTANNDVSASASVLFLGCNIRDLFIAGSITTYGSATNDTAPFYAMYLDTCALDAKVDKVWWAGIPTLGGVGGDKPGSANVVLTECWNMVADLQGSFGPNTYQLLEARNFNQAHLKFNSYGAGPMDTNTVVATFSSMEGSWLWGTTQSRAYKGWQFHVDNAGSGGGNKVFFYSEGPALVANFLGPKWITPESIYYTNETAYVQMTTNSPQANSGNFLFVRNATPSIYNGRFALTQVGTNRSLFSYKLRQTPSDVATGAEIKLDGNNVGYDIEVTGVLGRFVNDWRAAGWTNIPMGWIRAQNARNIRIGTASGAMASAGGGGAKYPVTAITRGYTNVGGLNYGKIFVTATNNLSQGDTIGITGLDDIQATGTFPISEVTATNFTYLIEADSSLTVTNALAGRIYVNSGADGFPVATYSRSGTTVTVTTTGAHSLAINDTVSFANIANDADILGELGYVTSRGASNFVASFSGLSGTVASGTPGFPNVEYPWPALYADDTCRNVWFDGIPKLELYNSLLFAMADYQPRPVGGPERTMLRTGRDNLLIHSAVYSSTSTTPVYLRGDTYSKSIPYYDQDFDRGLQIKSMILRFEVQFTKIPATGLFTIEAYAPDKSGTTSKEIVQISADFAQSGASGVRYYDVKVPTDRFGGFYVWVKPSTSSWYGEVKTYVRGYTY